MRALHTQDDCFNVVVEYTRETIKLGEIVDKYFSLDPFDPERSTVVKVRKRE